MSFRRKANKVAFVLLDRILPAYNHCGWGNRLKNVFAKRAFVHVGTGVNWGKRLNIESDFSIGDNSGVGDYARITPKVTIGNDVMIGKHLRILTTNHKTDRTDIPMRLQGFEETSPLKIGNDVWVCDNVIITPGCSCVGDGAILAAGAVVTHDVEPYSIVGGNPARVIRYRK